MENNHKKENDSEVGVEKRVRQIGEYKQCYGCPYYEKETTKEIYCLYDNGLKGKLYDRLFIDKEFFVCPMS